MQAPVRLLFSASWLPPRKGFEPCTGPRRLRRAARSSPSIELVREEWIEIAGALVVLDRLAAATRSRRARRRRPVRGPADDRRCVSGTPLPGL